VVQTGLSPFENVAEYSRLTRTSAFACFLVDDAVRARIHEFRPLCCGRAVVQLDAFVVEEMRPDLEQWMRMGSRMWSRYYNAGRLDVEGFTKAEGTIVIREFSRIIRIWMVHASILCSGTFICWCSVFSTLCWP